MRRILIAEDEFLVRIGLKTTIDWKTHGYVIVGEASNGKEALKMFEDTNPDILMTDIKMPLMDGLELLAEVKKRKPDTQVIILSNHDDFEYARIALRHGAGQYLLKSEINEAAILGALQSLLEDKLAKPAEETTLQSKQEQFLRRYVHSRLSFDHLRLQVSEEKWAVFPEGVYLAIRGDGEVILDEEFDEDTAIKNMESLLNTAFDGAVCCSSFQNNRLMLTVLYPVRSGAADELLKIAQKVDTLVRNAKFYFDLDLHIGLSQFQKGREFPVLFEQAETARLYCFFSEDSQAVFGNFEIGGKSQEPQINRNRLRELAVARDQKELESHILSIFTELRLLCNYSVLRDTYVELLSAAKQIRMEQHTGSSSVDGELSSEYNRFEQMASLNTVQNHILDVYRALLEAISGKEELYSYTIRKCKQFLDERYADSISLDTVAHAVGISKSYLSMVFKQEMGINFSVYLTNYRIEQAKQLLCAGNMKIYEIAEKVGFSTPYYFSKVFKEQTGMTCKEYKDAYGV